MNRNQARRYLYHRYDRWQHQALLQLVWLETNMASSYPHWSPEFVRNYLISRYADIWQHYHDSRDQYYRLTEPERNLYRLHLVADRKLCEDVIANIASYL